MTGPRTPLPAGAELVLHGTAGTAGGTPVDDLETLRNWCARVGPTGMALARLAACHEPTRTTAGDLAALLGSPRGNTARLTAAITRAQRFGLLTVHATADGIELAGHMLAPHPPAPRPRQLTLETA